MPGRIVLQAEEWVSRNSAGLELVRRDRLLGSSASSSWVGAASALKSDSVVKGHRGRMVQLSSARDFRQRKSWFARSPGRATPGGPWPGSLLQSQNRTKRWQDSLWGPSTPPLEPGSVSSLGVSNTADAKALIVRTQETTEKGCSDYLRYKCECQSVSVAAQHRRITLWLRTRCPTRNFPRREPARACRPRAGLQLAGHLPIARR